MKTEIRQFTRATALKFPFLAFFFALLLVNMVNAQSVSHITSGTVAHWSVDQDLNYSVVVDNGAVLRIDAGVNVNIYYADLTGDSEGDFRIEVADGGRLIIDGTPDNPVVFGPKEGSPHAIHWQGIILDANETGSSQDTLKFFEVNYAKKGLVINRPVQLHAPSFDHVQTGIEVNALTPSANLVVPAVTMTNVTGTGLTIRQPNTSIPYLKMSTLTGGGNGIEIYEDNITIDWAAISAVSGNGIVVKTKGSGVIISNSSIATSGKSGIFNDQSTANLTLTNCSVTGSTKSGLFNVDGTATISNSTFSTNGYSGIVNSSGTMTITNSNVSSNTVFGISACGLSTTTGTTLNITNNTSYGVNIVENKVLTDVNPLTGTAESAPTANITYSNITGNNGTSEDVNNASTSTIISEDFRYNYWGVASNVGAQVKYLKSNSVDYIYWVTSGVAYTVPGADLSTALTLSVDDKSATGGLNYAGTAPLTVNWTTTGNFRFVEIVTTEGAAIDTVYLANTGTYTFTPNNTANVSVKVAQEDSTSNSKTVTFTRKTVTTLTFPKKDGSSGPLAGGQAITINWASSSTIKKVKLEYKLNGGSYKTIADNIAANTGSYPWMIPNLDVKAAGGLYIKITERDGGTAGDSSSSGTAIIPSVDASWSFTPTGLSENFNITSITEDTVSSDGSNTQDRMFTANEYIYIGAFYPDGLAYKCAGYVRTQVSAVTSPDATINTTGAALTVYGDDPLTPAKEGYKEDDALLFRVWRAAKTDGQDDAWGADFGKLPNGDQGGNVRDLSYAPATINFTKDNLVAAQVLKYLAADSTSGGGSGSGSGGGSTPPTGSAKLRLDLRDGSSAKWFLYSSYVDPTVKTLTWKPAAADTETVSGIGENLILSPMTIKADNAGLTEDETQGFTVGADAGKFVMMKDGNGKVYWVNAGAVLVDGLNNKWDVTKGYFIKMNSNATGYLQLNGTYVDPQTKPLSLVSGWNVIPYLRYDTLATDIALSSIARGLVIAKDIDGNIYWPAYGINTLTELRPGKAYMVNLSSTQTLTYPANTGTVAINPVLSKLSAQAEANEHFKMNYNSDNNAVVAILEGALRGRANIGDEIGVVNSEGKLCGSAVYNGGNTAVMIFGIESGKTEGNGMKTDESYSFRLYNKNTGKESFLSGIKYVEGLGKYSANGMSVIGGIDKIESAVPQDFALSQNYPNPFNPSTTINFAVPHYSKVSVVVYNTLGQMVRVLADGFFEAGYHSVQFNAQNLSSGVYIYQIRAGNFTAAKKLNLLK